MGMYKTVDKVKLFVGIITKFVNNSDLYMFVKQPLISKFGNIDLQLSPMPFTFTDYYEKEQGSSLYRVFYSFNDLISPDELPKIKRLTNFLEEKLRTAKNWGVQRPFNFDPGYVNLSQVVLGSTKPYSHRLYLGKYVYGEVTLMFKNNSFVDLPWTYPDYRSSEYKIFFNKMRAALKTWKKTKGMLQS